MRRYTLTEGDCWCNPWKYWFFCVTSSHVTPYVMGLGLVHSVIGFEEVNKQSGEGI